MRSSFEACSWANQGQASIDEVGQERQNFFRIPANRALTENVTNGNSQFRVDAFHCSDTSTTSTLSTMSFLRNGAAPSGGINTDKIEMAITECVLLFLSFGRGLLTGLYFRLDTVTDFFNRMVQSVQMDAFSCALY